MRISAGTSIAKVIVGIAVVLGVGIATPAQAESQYRYWSFWQSDGSQWNLATVGVASVPVKQGTVQGWRFITAGVDVAGDLAPRLSANFAELCPNAPTPEGGLASAAIVIDYGTQSDYADGSTPPAPRVACTSVPEGTSSAAALAQVSEVRENAGFVCGLDQLPTTGCGEQVQVEPRGSALLATDSPNPSGDASTEDQWDLLATIVTTALGVVVFVMAWRRMMLQKSLKQPPTDGGE